MRERGVLKNHLLGEELEKSERGKEQVARQGRHEEGRSLDR